MRILIVSEVFPPAVSGVAVAAHQLAINLIKQGHTVAVLTTGPDRMSHQKEEEGLMLYEVPSWPNPFRPGLRYAVRPSRMVRQVIDEFKPEIVHLHDPASLCATTLREASRRGIPVVATNHFLMEFVLAYFAQAPLAAAIMRHWLPRRVRRMYDQCALVIVPTETARLKVAALGSRAPLRVISNGVEVARYANCSDGTEFMKKYDLPTDEPVIGYVGRIDPEKNLNTLLRAMALVVRERPARLVMVGAGRSVEGLQALAVELSITSHIIWTGAISSDSELLPQAYRSCQLFCLPSPIEVESIATLEAMAAGLPIVAAKAGALPELVQNGRNGFLVEALDVAGWSSTISQVLADETARMRMAEQSQKIASSRDIGASIIQLEDAYRTILQR